MKVNKVMQNQMQKNIIWNAFGNIVYLGAQWLVTVMVTRLMGYEDAGILSLAMSISAAFQTIALFGIRNYQASDINDKYSDNCYVMFRNITCSIALIMCLSFALICHYSATQIMSILWFMLFRLAEDYSDVLHGILQKADKLYIGGQSFFIRGFVLLLGFFAGRAIIGTLNGGLAFMAVLSWLTTIFFDYLRTYKISHFGLYDKVSSCFKLAKETFPLCVYSFLNGIINTAPKFILEKMCDKEILGAYSSVFIPALLIQAVAVYIYTPIIPRIAILLSNNNLDVFWKLTKKIFLIIILCGFSAIILALIFGKQALILLFGKSISQYTYLLIPIIICAFITALYAFIQALAIVMREFKTLILSCVIGIIVECISSVLLISMLSANGASFGLIAGTACQIVCIIGIIKKKGKI